MAHSLLAAFDVSAMLSASETAFWLIEPVGGAVLIYLGVPERRSANPTSTATLLNAPKAPLKVIFWRVILNNRLNPKEALSVLTFVPQFVRKGNGANPTSSSLAQMLLLVGNFSILT